MSSGLPAATVPVGDGHATALRGSEVVVHQHDHRVQFYDDHRFLAGVVADFIGEGLVAGENIVVIATPSHRTAFCNRLESRGLDVAEARRSGQLTLLDAERTLERFMVAGQPHWERFRGAIEEVIAAASARRPGVALRAYGEMVDLLWQRDNGPAAIRLEQLWNDLARLHPFALLCAYVMGTFHREADSHSFDDICRTHTQVAPAESYDLQSSRADMLRQVSVLQQRARALETEVARGRELEASLRRALEEQKRTEEALRAGEQRLLEQNEELSRTVRFSETFLGMLGHDLRNPLSGIATAASLLARRAQSVEGPQAEEAEKVRRPAQRILNSTARMARMIDQLLDFTHIRLGQGLPLTLRRQDLGSLAELCLEELKAEVKPAPLVTRQGDLEGLWDGDRLCQLIGNLLGNAITHRTSGTPVEIHLDGREAEAVLLEVHNRGAITGDLLRVIFEPFRGAESEGRKQARSSGLGLGLFISQQIVLAHQGRIEVASSEDTGTRFIVRLPRTAEVSGTVSPLYDTPAASG